MADQASELILDKIVAEKAARQTEELMRVLETPAGSRNVFANKVGNAEIGKAEEIIGSQRDLLTGLTLDRVVRRNVAEMLSGEEPRPGVYLELDLMGLKLFNSISPKNGDNALVAVAEFLNGFGFAQVGRKGDEFPCYFPDISEYDFRIKFSNYLAIMRAEGKLKEKDSGLEILTYWDCARIDDVKDLNGMVERIEKNVEDVKANVGQLILKKINKEPVERRADFMALYLYEKYRVAPEAIAAHKKSVVDDFMRTHDLPADRSIVDESVLEKVPLEVKTDMHRFQEEALKELKQI